MLWKTKMPFYHKPYYKRFSLIFNEMYLTSSNIFFSPPTCGKILTPASYFSSTEIIFSLSSLNYNYVIACSKLIIKNIFFKCKVISLNKALPIIFSCRAKLPLQTCN